MSSGSGSCCVYKYNGTDTISHFTTITGANTAYALGMRVDMSSDAGILAICNISSAVQIYKLDGTTYTEIQQYIGNSGGRNIQVSNDGSIILAFMGSDVNPADSVTNPVVLFCDGNSTGSYTPNVTGDYHLEILIL